MRLRLHRVAAAAAVAIVLLASCSPASDDGGGSGDDSGKTTVTFRLWDSQVAKAYEKSFAEFEKQNDQITVDVEVIPWDEYWTRLPQDVGSGDMADIFWTNSANFVTYANNGDLINITEELGDQTSAWKQSVIAQYTRDGALWGVPQLWDSIALYYNKDLVNAANVDPESLRWDPEDPSADTLLPAAQSMTLDAEGRTADRPGFDPASIEQFGFNAALDQQAIYLDFVGSNGGTWQEDDVFAMDNPQTAAAMQYVVALINTHHVSPSAADTNTNGEKTRDLFLQGKMALYQSGPYRLKDIQEGAEFEWGIAPMVEGPSGRVSAVNGVIAAGYADTAQRVETLEVLRWLGTAEGQRPIAAGGYAFPGVTEAEPAFISYWSDQGVDIEAFVEAANGEVIYPPAGAKAQAGMTAVQTIMEEVFLGRTPVTEGLREAEVAGNDAMSE